MNRLHSFDYIRVIALFGILICHSLFLFPECEWVGRYFAQCFNFVFLILSAFLLGLSWEKKERVPHKIAFLKHRFSKLSWSYYPFLIILFVFLTIVGYQYSTKDIVMYAAFLAWFNKIPGFGHVWFLTMIAFAYLGVYVYSHFHSSKIRENTFGRNKQWLNWLLIMTTVVILHSGITAAGLPGYMILYLALYVIVFRYAGRVLNSIGEISIGVLAINVIICHSASLVAYRHNLFENMYLSPIVGVINGLTLFALLFRLFQLCRQSKAIAFVSGVSFETYLLHEFFIYNGGIYNTQITPPVNLLIFSIIAITAGWVLKEGVGLVQKLSMHFSSNKKPKDI